MITEKEIQSFDKSMSEMFRQHDYIAMYQFYQQVLRHVIQNQQSDTSVLPPKEEVLKPFKELIEMWEREAEEAYTVKFIGKTKVLRAYVHGKHNILEWVVRELKLKVNKYNNTNDFFCHDECVRNAAEDYETPKCKTQCEKCTGTKLPAKNNVTEQIKQLKCQCKKATFIRSVDADFNPLCGRCGKPI